jgi:hypothetical protein
VCALNLETAATPSQDVRDLVERTVDLACEELAISMQSLDVWKREQIAEMILSLASDGERDVELLQRRAVTHFRNLGEATANP